MINEKIVDIVSRMRAKIASDVLKLQDIADGAAKLQLAIDGTQVQDPLLDIFVKSLYEIDDALATIHVQSINEDYDIPESKY